MFTTLAILFVLFLLALLVAGLIARGADKLHDAAVPRRPPVEANPVEEEEASVTFVDGNNPNESGGESEKATGNPVLVSTNPVLGSDFPTHDLSDRAKAVGLLVEHAPAVLKWRPIPGDQFSALLPPEVMISLGLDPGDARALYPMALASLTVSTLQFEGMNVAGIEFEGFDSFRAKVRSEHAGSNFEDWEIREAFDMIRQYIRDPRRGLRLRATTKARQRRIEEVQQRLAAGAY